VTEDIRDDFYDKRRIKSPFRYPGGKFYALKHILPFINAAKHDEYREPFVGGGAIFFAKPRVAHNWLNDIDEDLMTTYRVIADPGLRARLVTNLNNEIATKQRHQEVKQIAPRTKSEIAFRTYYLNRTSFSGILNKPAWGYAVGQSAPPKNWASMIIPAGKKLRDVKLTASDFEDVLNAPAAGDRVLLYLDPPYFSSDQKRAYSWSFTTKEHIRVEKTLRDTDFMFCLSYDDSPEIRKMYSWANIYERSWLYNTANCRGIQRKMGNELIITNYRVGKTNQDVLF